MNKAFDTFQKALAEYTPPTAKSEHRMYYVYYNECKSLTAISPVHDENLSSRFEYTMLPFNEVIAYLDGKKQMHTAVLMPIKDSNKFIISERRLEAVDIQYVDRQLIEIPKQMTDHPGLTIENNVKDKLLTFHLHEDLREVKETYYTDTLKLYFTARLDPHLLIEDIFVDVRSLHTGLIIEISYTQDLEQCSLYTKRMFNYYSYGTT